MEKKLTSQLVDNIHDKILNILFKTMVYEFFFHLVMVLLVKQYEILTHFITFCNLGTAVFVGKTSTYLNFLNGIYIL